MYTVDKIKYHVMPEIIKAIDNCVNLQKTEILKKWLTDCIAEIERRQKQKENTFPLVYGKAYLEMVLR